MKLLSRKEQKTTVTLNLHRNVGDGIIATVLNGVVTPFISFPSIRCTKPSSAPFSSSLVPESFFYNYKDVPRNKKKEETK